VKIKLAHFFETRCRTTKFRQDVGRGVCLGSSTILLQGAGSQSSPILGVPFYLCVHFLSQNYRIDLITQRMSGRGVYLNWVSHASHLKRAELQRSPILGVLRYLCLHRLTQKDQIQHGNQYGEGVFLENAP